MVWNRRIYARLLENNSDQNSCIAQLYGINLNAAIHDIPELNLGAPASSTIDQVIALNG